MIRLARDRMWTVTLIVAAPSGGLTTFQARRLAIEAGVLLVFDERGDATAAYGPGAWVSVEEE